MAMSEAVAWVRRSGASAVGRIGPGASAGSACGDRRGRPGGTSGGAGLKKRPSLGREVAPAEIEAGGGIWVGAGAEAGAGPGIAEFR